VKYVFSSSFSFCLISSRFWMYCYIPSTYLRQWSGLGNIGNCHYICSAVHLCISQILSLTCDSIHCFFPTDCCHIWKKYLLTKFCESNKVWWCYTAISIQWWTQYAVVRGQRSIIGSRPSDHYFHSVCLSVCLFVCAEFFSAVFDPILIKLGHMLYAWV